ncbi:MAG: tetratricopeptide repeat protein [Flavobacteriales bacterium]|nr:tetratricopeptide repeat protein [Flavobacteriales bacterium]
MFNKNTIISFLLIILLASSVKAISATDSLLYITKTSQADTIKIKAFNELVKKVFYYDPHQAMAYSDSALSLSKKINNTYWEGITRINKSSLLYHTEKYKEGIEQASICLKIFSSLRSELNMAKSYNNLCLLYQAVGDYPTALDFAYQALRIAEKINNLSQLANIHNNIGMIYYLLGMQNKSTEYFLKSLDDNIKSENKQGMAIGYLNMSSIFVEKNELKKAQEFLLKALQINKEFNHNVAIAQCYTQLSNIQYLKKNTDSALIYINWAKDIYLQIKDSLGLATVHYNKSKYLKNNNILAALEELIIAERYIAPNIDLQQKISIYSALSELYAIKKDYKNAYQSFHLANLLKDSLNNFEQKKKVQEMQIRFETKRMENEISRLQQITETKEKENTQQQNELKRSKSQQALLLFIVSALAIMSVLLIAILMNRTKLNKKLSLQNLQILKQKEEKETLLKEIHHRVKNNLQIVNSLLRLQSNQINDEKITELFEEAQNRIITMALIHEKIYRTENLAQIDFKEYIEALSGNLVKTYNLNKLIKIEKNIEVEHFGIDQLVPIGLILNEMLSNSFKHAFTNILEGRIWISFRINSEKKYELIVGDNGKGLNSIEFENPSSLGLELIKTFTEQLNGCIELNTKKGTEYKIVF